MFISLIVPIYNIAPDLLGACLASASMQTLRKHEYEVILVDDASTSSDTLQLMAEHTQHNQNVVLVKHATNLGLNAARQSGVNASRGDYIVFLDGDDVLTSDALELLRRYAYVNDADVVTAPLYKWFPRTKSYTDIQFTQKAFPNGYMDRLSHVISGKFSYTMCGRLFRRRLLGSDIFAMPNLYHEDLTTFIRIMFNTNVTENVPEPLYYYSDNDFSITKNTSKEHADGIFFALEDWIDEADRYDLLGELITSISDGAARLLDDCVLKRCISNPQIGVESKLEILESVGKRFAELALPPSPRALQWRQYRDVILSQDADAKRQLIPSPQRHIEKGLIPTEMALRLKDKIVFIGDADYQIRNAAAFANELRKEGYACVILDNSGVASSGARELSRAELGDLSRVEYLKVGQVPYEPDALATARLVISFNDWSGYFREALEYRRRVGLPSACMIEGVNDFLRVDSPEFRRNLPYRRSDIVLLAGSDDETFFEDRQTYTIGLPIIESLARKVPKFSDPPFIVLNVNFTYGVLEDERDEYVSMAARAFEALESKWVVTQHPMDKGDLDGFPISQLSQYELIDQCSVFVSRFGTGILEALASGKPAIYFNPHGEKVPKFGAPKGAFEVATNEKELVGAVRKTLSDIDAGVDFRKRASGFLERHTSYLPEQPSCTRRLADAVRAILAKSSPAEIELSKQLLEKLRV